MSALIASLPVPALADGANRAERVYETVKREIFDFVLFPGDRFSESEIAERTGVSRTPVREALQRLAREGYLEVASRTGWRVKPLDFEAFDQLYDVRVIIELAAVRKLCEVERQPALAGLKDAWLVPPSERLDEPKAISALDEAFHATLVAATGNAELARIHREITERIRIIRRLDFTKAPRVDTTYTEHARILRAVMQRKADQAQLMLRTHIETSKAEVRKITLHMLYQANRR